MGRYGRYETLNGSDGPDIVSTRRVPRVSDQILGCVFYLYKDKHAAKLGDEKGATGFLVAIPSLDESRVYIYAPTARHVVAQGYSVLRVNTLSGNPKIIERTLED